MVKKLILCLHLLLGSVAFSAAPGPYSFIGSYYVGFGNACLVITPEYDTQDHFVGNTAILIDVGTKAHAGGKTWIMDKVVDNISQLINQHAQKIIVIITHPHLDHLSHIVNVLQLVDSFKVSQVIVGGILPYNQKASTKTGVIPNTTDYLVKNHSGVLQSIVTEQELEKAKSVAPKQNPCACPPVMVVGPIRILRCMGDFPATKSINSQGIIVGINFTDINRSNKQLLFMGDAPGDTIQDTYMDMIWGWCCAPTPDSIGPIFWYQIPHHGSAKNGEFGWIRRILVKTSVINAVCSTVIGVHDGIPNGGHMSKSLNALLILNPADMSILPGDYNYFLFATNDINSKESHVYFFKNSDTYSFKCTHSEYLLQQCVTDWKDKIPCVFYINGSMQSISDGFPDVVKNYINMLLARIQSTVLSSNKSITKFSPQTAKSIQAH